MKSPHTGREQRSRQAATTVLVLVALCGFEATAEADDFVVDRIDDPVVPIIGSTCTLSSNDCSLRGAIWLANTRPGLDNIIIPVGTYTLTQAGQDEDAGWTGDLDITEQVNISSTGDASNTFIDADNKDRVFHILSGTVGVVTISGVTIRNGRPTGQDGAGIANFSSNLTLDGCTVSGNTTSGDGGGVYSHHPPLGPYTQTWIKNGSVITDNHAAKGGGVYAEYAALFVDDSTISGNTASYAGGVRLYSSDTTITRSTISGNAANVSGGGLSCTSDTVELINSTVFGNTADIRAAGISVSGTHLILDSVTISGNTTPGAGSAVQVLNDLGHLEVTNTILHGSCDIASGATVTSNGGNLESDGNSCRLDGMIDQLNVNDPRLSYLGDFGGYTQTVMPFADSPALGAAEPSECLDEDQRGEERVNLLGMCDVGSVERLDDDPLFVDGFEFGDISRWTSSTP